MKTFLPILSGLTLLLSSLSSCKKEQQPKVEPFPAGFRTDVAILAGNGNPGDLDGPGASATFKAIWGIAMDAVGNTYVTDNGSVRIRKITPQGVVTTLDDNPNASGSMLFANADGMAIDAAGNFYVSYSTNNCIRKISPDGKTGVIFAGSPTGDGGNADGNGTDARFEVPTGLAIDASGNIYVADAGNAKIRKITPAGAVTTVAGNGVFGLVDGAGTQAEFYEPYGVTLDKSGNIYVADGYNFAVRKITPDGTVSTIASGGTETGNFVAGAPPLFDVPIGIAVAADGTLFVTNYADGVIKRIQANGSISTVGQDIRYNGLYIPTGMVIDKSGALYVASSGTYQVIKIVPQANKYLGD